MAKRKLDKLSKEIDAAIKRFPKVVKTQERRALEEQRFLKRTFGALVKDLGKKR